MKIKKGPLRVFTEPGYWVVGLNGGHTDDRYWDVFLQKSENYFNFGLLTRLTGDLIITREGEPFGHPHLQEIIDEQREQSRFQLGRWYLTWRSMADIRQIQKENRERESLRTNRA